MTLADRVRARLGNIPGAPYGETLNYQLEAALEEIAHDIQTIHALLAQKIDKFPTMHADGTQPQITARSKPKRRVPE